MRMGLLVDVAVTLGWAALWTAANLFVARPWWFPSKNKLTLREAQVAEYTVGLIHAVISTGIGAMVATDPSMRRDVIWSSSRVFGWGYLVTMGYMVYDFVLILQALANPTPFSKGERALQWQYVAHHILVMSAGFYKMVVRTGAGDLFGSVCLLLEATNIPHNLRQMLLSAKLTERPWIHVPESSPAMLLLGVCFLLMYLMCRFVLVLWLFVLYAAQIQVPLSQVFSNIPYKCTIGTSMLLAMNAYWMKFIVAKIVRRVRPSTTSNVRNVKTL
eukprot:TRINITY_DN25840_c0_g1_i2.p1 TRINITY_DN25840_c0_g1~~TRINITY_DN25840_c0_g1_i2.p1  ORF type:complete len:273 (+),score=38.46 TRINITY_DN25840_c0_g1_i2:61-879(+)